MTAEPITHIPAARHLTWLAWLPFGLVSALHLLSKPTAWIGLDHLTKPLLMPALAIAVVVLGLHGRLLPVVALLVGTLLSWFGDITVDNLIMGLSFFLLAHIAHIVMMVSTFPRGMSRWALLYPVWFAALLVALWSSLGAFRAPLIVYGVALGIMAAIATRGGKLTAIGGAVFVGSDTLLAFRLFTSSMQGPVADFSIMALYLAAQGLLAAGVLRALNEDARLGLRHGGRSRQTRTDASLSER